MKCPKCSSEALRATTVRGVEVDQCPGCGGIWFDEQELSRLLAQSPGELRPLTRTGTDAETDRVKGRCPRDGQPLLRVRSAHARAVAVDVCPRCRGVWLDGGELRRLLAAG